ncbi:CobW family GTP-binding protein [Halomonas huangheensis]|nr:GTP-binding protein [Halomonas huangheensis]ALM54703.1 cobalamin synthesis protein P47K [Halomonas huangheensis]
MTRPIPVTIVSGFLGSGKTTLLNRILNSDTGMRMAVMVNDFGAVNIDSELIVSQTDSMISLANGCICCTVESDLIEQLQRLISSPDSRPEYLIIEASGVSNPTRIVSTLRYPQFAGRLAIDSTITVVDAEQFAGLEGEMAQLAMEQLDVADIVLLNKIDIATQQQIADFKQRWSWPGIRLHETRHCEIPLSLVIGTGNFDPLLHDQRLHQTSGHAHHCDEHCQHGEHQHSHHDHGELFDTWYWQCDQPLSLSALRRALATLPLSVYRAKGFCQLAELGDRSAILHLVGSRHDIQPGEPWGEQPPMTRLVVIGTHGGFDRTELEQTFNACIADHAAA